ncbi:MAG: hypothetical protein AAGD14_01615 [Planctomycetota bacterium]
MTARRWTLVFLGVNLAWRLVRYALDFPIWGDEARVAVNFFDRGLKELMQPLDYLQVVPIGFLWAEWGMSRVFGLGEYALRFLPVVAGVASLFVFRRLAEKTLDRTGAVCALALFAASYYPVRHATEVKSYSIDLLAGTVLLLQGTRLLEGARVWPFALTAAIFAWWSYPSVFVAGGIVAVVWLHRRDPRLVAAGFAFTASFAVMYLLVGATQASAGTFHLTSSHWEDAFPPLREFWRLPLWLLDMHTGNMFAYPNGGNNFGSTATFLLFCMGVYTLWRTRRRLLLALLLSPFPIMFLAAALHKYPYGGSARITQQIAPVICLVVGAGIPGIAFALRKPQVPKIWYALMLLFAVGGLVRDIVKPYKHEADAAARTALAEIGTLPETRWVVFAALERSPFAPTLPLTKDGEGWGGTWARTHYYILRNGPPDLRFAPDPAMVEPGGPTLLLTYRDNGDPFPDEQFARYRDRLEAGRGEPTEIRRIPLRERKPEALGVFRYSR